MLALLRQVQKITGTLAIAAQSEGNTFFWLSKNFMKKERKTQKWMCTSPLKEYDSNSQKERMSIKSTKDMEGVPPRACIQSNNICKICSLYYLGTTFDSIKDPFHTTYSNLNTRAWLATFKD